MCSTAQESQWFYKLDEYILEGHSGLERKTETQCSDNRQAIATSFKG